MVREIAEETGMPLRDTAMGIRVALTGNMVGPSLWDILSIATSEPQPRGGVGVQYAEPKPGY